MNRSGPKAPKIQPRSGGIREPTAAAVGEVEQPRAPAARYRSHAHTSDTRHFLIDLYGVKAIDAAGMGSLAALERWARSETRTIFLANLSRRVRAALETTGLSSVLQILLISPERLLYPAAVCPQKGAEFPFRETACQVPLR